jgi:hypothetical protein
MCWGSPDIGSKHNVGTPVASHRTHRCNTHRKLSFSSARFHDTGSEDCTAGDQWACDLLDALSHRRANDIQTPGSAKDDVDAILKGIDRARSDCRPRAENLRALCKALKLPIQATREMAAA